MAESQSKIDAAAEKAFAEAAEKKTAAGVTAKPAPEPVQTAPVAKNETAPVAKNETAPIAKIDAAPIVKADAAPKIVAAPNAKPAVKKAAVKKPTAKKVAARKAVAKKPAVARKAAKVPAKKPAARIAAKPVTKTASTTPITKLKEKIMATTTKTPDFTAKMKETAAEVQTRAKAAYDKGTEMTADVTAFHKGNFDAMVESGKVLAAGMQDMGRTAVEDAKAAAETVTADVKKMAAIKSPTELLQLQGEIARRNLDTMVSKTSKNAEVMMKLVTDMFAPLSTRASVAMDRLKKAA